MPLSCPLIIFLLQLTLVVPNMTTPEKKLQIVPDGLSLVSLAEPEYSCFYNNVASSSPPHHRCPTNSFCALDLSNATNCEEKITSNPNYLPQTVCVCPESLSGPLCDIPTEPSSHSFSEHRVSSCENQVFTKRINESIGLYLSKSTSLWGESCNVRDERDVHYFIFAYNSNFWMDDGSLHPHPPKRGLLYWIDSGLSRIVTSRRSFCDRSKLFMCAPCDNSYTEGKCLCLAGTDVRRYQAEDNDEIIRSDYCYPYLGNRCQNAGRYFSHPDLTLTEGERGKIVVHYGFNCSDNKCLREHFAGECMRDPMWNVSRTHVADISCVVSEVYNASAMNTTRLHAHDNDSIDYHDVHSESETSSGRRSANIICDSDCLRRFMCTIYFASLAVIKFLLFQCTWISW